MLLSPSCCTPPRPPPPALTPNPHPAPHPIPRSWSASGQASGVPSWQARRAWRYDEAHTCLPCVRRAASLNSQTQRPWVHAERMLRAVGVSERLGVHTHVCACVCVCGGGTSLRASTSYRLMATRAACLSAPPRPLHPNTRARFSHARTHTYNAPTPGRPQAREQAALIAILYHTQQIEDKHGPPPPRPATGPGSASQPYSQRKE